MIETSLEKKIKKCSLCGELDMILISQDLCSDCKKNKQQQMQNALEF